LLGDRRAVDLAREAVAIDSTFAMAWSSLGAYLSNYGASRSARDSAITQAYRYRDRLSALEKAQVTGRYFALGPGRDRAKAIATYEKIIRDGDTISSILVNLAEVLRLRREFARAESLNIAAARLAPGTATALGNTAEMQLNQGKYTEAAATIDRLSRVSRGYGGGRRFALAFVTGDFRAARGMMDSLLAAGPQARANAIAGGRAFALLDGRLRAAETVMAEQRVIYGMSPVEANVDNASAAIIVAGPSPERVARLDTAIASIPFLSLPMVDRPYLDAAKMLARAGATEKARAMITRYQAEMTDTSIRREQQAEMHSALGEIALSAGNPRDAIVEFGRSDVGYDGAPANECAPCLSFKLARAFDAAGKPDSAALMFERYIATPYWLKADTDLDPLRLPAIRERLGQIYESLGKTDKAIENYRAFVDLWKNADPELQPRVADARRRLARLTPVENTRR